MVVGDDTETTPKSSASTPTSGDHHNQPTSQQAAATATATSTSTSTGVAASPSPRPAPPSGFTAINLGPEEEEQEFVFDEADHGVIGAWWWCCERCDIARNRWRTILAALFLFALGVIFAATAAWFFYAGDIDRGIAFVVVSCLCGIPGSYQTYVLIRALRSDPGWDISMVPSYDDD